MSRKLRRTTAPPRPDADQLDLQPVLAVVEDHDDRDEADRQPADIVLEIGADNCVSLAAGAVQRILGWTADDLHGRPSSELIAEADRAHVAQNAARVRNGETVEVEERRLLTANGDVRWMSARAMPRYNEGGDVIGGRIELRDCHSEVIARRAARTLSAANALLARSRTEQEILDGMCRAAVREGGYVFSWYGRPVLDAKQSIEYIAWSEAEKSYLDEIEVSWGDNPLGRGPTGESIRNRATYILNDMLPAPTYAPWSEAANRHGFRSCISLPVLVDGEVDGAFVCYAGEAHAFTDDTTAVLEDMASHIGIGIERIRAFERLERLSNERALLANAIDQAAESVVITGVDGRVEYANPAALISTGQTADEVIGHSSTVFDEIDEVEANARMRSTLTRGATWSGAIAHRRPDGSFAEVDLNISPVFDDAGRHIAYVALGRDVTVERALEADLDRAQSDRAAISTVMERMRPGDSLETTVAAFCDATCQISWIDRTTVLLTHADGTLARAVAAGHRLDDVPVQAVATLASAIDLVVDPDGPIVFDLSDPQERERLRAFEPHLPEAFRAQGFTAGAYAPIQSGHRTIGLVGFFSVTPDGFAKMSASRGILTDLGSYAGSLLTSSAEEQDRVERIRSSIRSTIDDRRFRPVFQPVVDLRTKEIRGYEALTRFDDGTRPDLLIAEAHACGLGLELEAACVTAAIDAARALPIGRWLGVNFAPATIIGGVAADALCGADRHIVIEITEHAKIDSYAALTGALRSCGDVDVSVDDAGAGYASLQHILELRPDCVKLDIGLVRGIDTDPARQALVAGLRHFGELTGTDLLAEGVETRAEADVLLALGVQYGQGYLFGRPESVR